MTTKAKKIITSAKHTHRKSHYYRQTHPHKLGYTKLVVVSMATAGTNVRLIRTNCM